MSTNPSPGESEFIVGPKALAGLHRVHSPGQSIRPQDVEGGHEQLLRLEAKGLVTRREAASSPVAAASASTTGIETDPDATGAKRSGSTASNLG